MKMIGISANSPIFLIRRQVSNPSIFGINASIRIRLGFTCPIKDRALAPLRTTKVVNPAFSRMSDNRLNVSGASSTARMVARAADSDNMEHQGLDCVFVAVKVAVFGEAA